MSIDFRWMGRFLELLAHPSGWSKDPSTQVGAVLVSPDRRVVLPGYNGFPPSIPDMPHLLANRDSKLARTIHAEQNVLQTAAKTGLRLAYPSGWTLFSTHCPCTRCSAIIVDSGVETVVYERRPEFEERWKADLIEAHEVLTEGGVSVYQRTKGRTEPRKSRFTSAEAGSHYGILPADPVVFGQSEAEHPWVRLEKAKKAYESGTPMSRINELYGAELGSTRENGRVRMFLLVDSEKIWL